MQSDLIRNRPSPPNFQDLTGQQFNLLTVLKRDTPRKKWQGRWICMCQCGQITSVITHHLLYGLVKSCGCLREKGTHGHTRGSKASLTYASWAHMLRRAKIDPGDPNFKYYKGIQVCERWLKFENFLADMGERPSKAHSIDRYPDPKGDYRPNNARWATKREQNRNFSRNQNITFQGRTMCITDWAKEIGITAPSLKKRLRRWTLEDAMTKPRDERRVHPPSTS